MNELIKINYDSENPTVSGREVHEFLEIKTPYHIWFSRATDYGFVENVDFIGFEQKCSKPQGGRPSIDHALMLDMAKELCMLEKNERGKQARQYFISIEKAWNTPEMVMSRALRMAEGNIKALKVENSRLVVDNQIMQPKAEYFDELVDRNLLTNFRETAKQIKVSEKVFVKFLLDHKYVFRNKKGKLEPYAAYAKSGLFEIKECINEKTNWSGTQTLITPKGRETFRLLLEGMKSA